MVPEILNGVINLEDYPPMCRHQSGEDDFQRKFMAFFDDSTLVM
jgi:hypothetical protein